MKLSEFARSISEVDVALGRLGSFACTEKGCGGMWATCDIWSMGKTRELLDRLRKLGLPDLPAELEKIVGRQVTMHDICVFTEINWLYSDCVSSEMSEGKCREKLRRALEGARERLKSAPELKKRLAGLLGKLGTVGRFRLEHSFPTGVTVLELPLDSCGTLGLWYNLPRKYFEATFHYPHEGPPARRVGEWLAGAVEDALRNLGLGRYRTTTDYVWVTTRLPGLDLDTAFRLFGLFAGLAPALGEACAAFSMRYRAGKTPKRERVRV